MHNLECHIIVAKASLGCLEYDSNCGLNMKRVFKEYTIESRIYITLKKYYQIVAKL